MNESHFFLMNYWLDCRDLRGTPKPDYHPDSDGVGVGVGVGVSKTEFSGVGVGIGVLKTEFFEAGVGVSY